MEFSDGKGLVANLTIAPQTTQLYEEMRDYFK